MKKRGGKSGEAEITSPPSEDGGDMKLRREVGLFSAITIIVGSIIGSGIFISPKGVLVNVGSPGVSLIVWFLSGIYCMIGAYCYAELATLIPSSGGDYTYIEKAFGGFVGFIRLWVEVIVVRPCIYAIVSLAFAYYVIEPVFPGCQQPLVAVQLLAATAILLLMVINCWSVRLSTIIQNVFTVAKVLALLMIIITGLVYLAMGKSGNMEKLKPAQAFEDTNWNVFNIALGFYSGLFAYNGWTWLNIVVEEMKNPEKNFPIAISVSLILVTLIYLLTNLAYFVVISPQELLSSPAVAVLFAKRVYGPVWWIIPVFVALSCFGTVNSGLLTASRLIFIGGREGHMPEVLNCMSTTRRTPIPAVIFTGVTSCIYLVSTDMYSLINYLGFSNWGAIALSVVALLYFRKKWPDAHRPIKVNLALPYMFIILTIALIIFSAIASPVETGIGVLILLTGVPVYWVCISWKNKPKQFVRFSEWLLQITQKMFIVCPEAKD